MDFLLPALSVFNPWFIIRISLAERCEVQRHVRGPRLIRAPSPRVAITSYWMQQAHRAVCDHALEYAIAQANEFGPPLLVCFG